MAFTRRHLPHWIPRETAVFVTWRLAGSVPRMPRWDRPSPFVVCHRSPRPSRSTDDEKRSSVPPFGPVCLQDPRIASVVADALLYGESGHHFYRLHAWVVMPNHVHAILWFPVPGQLSVFMQQWKRLSSHHIGGLVQNKFVHYAEKIGGDDPFWQAKYYPFNLYSEEKVREKLTYMHENPVRAGLVAKACDWVFSSARYYEQGRSVGVPIRWIE